VPSHSSIYFVDTKKKKILILNIKTNKKRIIKIDKEIGFLVHIKKNIFILGLQSELRIVNLDNKKTIGNKIYNSRKDRIEILEDNGTYIFYNIDKLITKLPNIEDDEFKKQIKNLLFQKEKYEFNKNIISEINQKIFNQASFNELGKNSIKKIKLNSIKDNKKFEINSVKILYSLPINSFSLITDDQNNVYVAKTVSYKSVNITKSFADFDKISIEEGTQSKNNILKSYDLFLNTRYKVIVNEKTLERVKNYFR